MQRMADPRPDQQVPRRRHLRHLAAKGGGPLEQPAAGQRSHPLGGRPGLRQGGLRRARRPGALRPRQLERGTGRGRCRPLAEGHRRRRQRDHLAHRLIPGLPTTIQETGNARQDRHLERRPRFRLHPARRRLG
ncbi:Exonuclease SbcC [Pseudomonas sp. OF001]|nr:Exonuclease SbcC [Pseudomonas sp. OF001]